MENLRSDLARGATGSPGYREDDGAAAPGDEKIIDAEQQQKNQEDCTPSLDSGSDGEPRSREDEKRAICADINQIPWDDEDEEKYQEIVRYINLMYEGPIEGFDWDEDRIHEEIDHYLEKLKGGLPDRHDLEFWVSYKDPQCIELNQRLALYRIRAYKEELRNLEDADLRHKYPSLEEGHYFVSYENHFNWYFDPVYCKIARLQDYQQLVLRDYGDYEEWEDYRRTCNTLEGDQQFVQFWDDLQEKTKWLIQCVKAGRCVWSRFERVAYYHALKIASGIPTLSESLFCTGYSEYLWTVKFEKTWLNCYVDFFLTIWKLVFQEKMDFKEALRKVYEGGKHYPLSSSELKDELDELDSDEITVPGFVQSSYEAHIAKIGGEVTEVTAHKLISDAVKKIILTHKTYYDYAKKKLDIAKEIGLIKP